MVNDTALAVPRNAVNCQRTSATIQPLPSPPSETLDYAELAPAVTLSFGRRRMRNLPSLTPYSNAQSER